MTHFSVLVIGENPEEQLGPFHEFECTGEDNEFIQDIDRTPEIKSDYMKTERKQNFRDYIEEEFGYKAVVQGTKPDLKDEHKYGYYLVDKKGNVLKIIRRTNPNPKWDWYVIGGRWSGMFKLKNKSKGKLAKPHVLGICKNLDDERIKTYEENLESKRVDSAEKKDIDFSPDKKIYKEAERRWELITENSKPKNKEEKEIVEWELYKPEYYIKRYKTKERYANQQSNFSVSCVLKNGTWLEAGEVGWFGSTSATPEEEGNWVDDFYNKFIKDLPEDTLLTVVDCHI